MVGFYFTIHERKLSKNDGKKKIYLLPSDIPLNFTTLINFFIVDWITLGSWKSSGFWTNNFCYRIQLLLNIIISYSPQCTIHRHLSCKIDTFFARRQGRGKAKAEAAAHIRLTSTKRFTNPNLSRHHKKQDILSSDYWNLINLNTSIIEL